MGVKNAGQRVVGLGKVAWRKTQEESFSSAKDEQVQAFGRRTALRKSLLSLCKVGFNQALRVCEGRQAQVEASEASFDTLDDPWPNRTSVHSPTHSLLPLPSSPTHTHLPPTSFESNSCFSCLASTMRSHAQHVTVFANSKHLCCCMR